MTLRENCLAAGAAGALAAVVTHPVDVLKTYMMVYNDRPGARYWDIWRVVREKFGLRGLLRGVGFRTMQMLLMSVFWLTGYEKVFEWLLRRSASA